MPRWIALALAPFAFLATVWACAALWIDGPASRPLAAVLALAVAGGSTAAWVVLRPPGRALPVHVALLAVVVVWWLSLAPSNDRDWMPDVAHPPTATLEGDRLTVRNVRNFHYRTDTDYDERWEERSFDLSKLQGVDLFVVHWGSPWIAHTILSWDFAGSPPLAISIEPRKEEGESYSALRAFFRQYELYYVAAEERDVIGVRAAMRGEQVFLYPTHMPVARARALLLDYVKQMNELAERPRWYNALTQSCSTALQTRSAALGGANRWDWQILVNGKLDELLYATDTIDTSLPFEELQRRSDVTARAMAAMDAPDFSARIREGLPGARP